jgi:hypothetical protein
MNIIVFLFMIEGGRMVAKVMRSHLVAIASCKALRQARSYRARTTAREPSFFVTRAAQAAGVLIDPRVFVRFRVFFVGVCQHVQLPPM